ncbi:MAG: FAD-dependent oxidoreductase [bacterium]
MAAEMPIEELACDVLVIGGGVAGMLAAMEAHEAGTDVLYLTKATFPAGSSSMARGGYAAALGHADPRDNPYVNWKDAIKSGYGINNQRLVRIMVEEALERTYTIDSWGLGLVKTEEEKFSQKHNAGDSYARFVHCVRMIGKPLMATLSGRVKALGVPLQSNAFVVDLLQDASGRVTGAWGFKHREGSAFAVRAKTTVLCTGGAPQLHRVNDSPPQVTGDGYPIALRAGAELIDMEMIDYQLMTGWPEKLAGYPPYSTGFIRAGARLLNRNGERFMKRYNPDAPDGAFEKAARALVNRGVGIEIFEGRGTDHGTVYLDAREIVDDVGEEILPIVQAYKNAGVNIYEEPIEVVSGPHTFLGGLRIDEHGRTTLPGLFAGGEAAGGIHGSNRLAGAALADSFVFGARAGKAAAREAAGEPLPDLPREAVAEGVASLKRRLSASGGREPADFRIALQENVFGNMGQVRSAERLREGMAILGALREEAASVPSEGETPRKRFGRMMHVIETENLIEVAAMLGTAALLREESRGGHYRSDFPEQDDANWLTNNALTRGDRPGELRTRLAPPRHRGLSAPRRRRGVGSGPKVPPLCAAPRRRSRHCAPRRVNAVCPHPNPLPKGEGIMPKTFCYPFFI